MSSSPRGRFGEPRRSMAGLAAFRIGLGAFAWVAPRAMNRLFGVPRAERTPALDYMTRVFGVRAIALGTGYLVSRGDARRTWHRLWLLCDAADTVMGAGMASRRGLTPITAAQALAITGAATAIDLAGLAAERK